jgi:dTDP-4-amino-4,6-dideoxygalactose transaminase
VVLTVKLSHIDSAIERWARHAAQQYRDLLKDVPAVKLPVIKGNAKEVYYVFCIQAENRDGLDLYLKEKGIGTSIYYPIPCICRNVLNT